MTPNVEVISEAPAAYVAELQLIPLSELHESPLNPRKYFAEGPLAELADSIRRGGIRTPLIARSRVAGSGYELAAGHRRLRAAQMAGIASAPVLVREMGDAEFLEVLTFENGQREDVHPLEEASGYQVYMRETLAGVAEVAAKTGKSGSHIYARLKLLDLTDAAARAFWDGKITAGHAVLIARRDPGVQSKALKYLEPPKWDPTKVPSVRDLDSWLHHELYKDLRRAPFEREDATLLAGAGGCGACPKRAANDPAYLAPAGVDPEADYCTDPRCYSQKVDNYLVHIKAAVAPDGQVLEISENWSTKRRGALASNKWDKVSKGTAGSQVAVVAEGSEVGKLVYVRIKKEHPQPHQQTPAEREQQKEAADRKVHAELAIRRRIVAAIRVKVGGLSRADLEGLLSAAVDHNSGDELCDLVGLKHQEHRGADVLIAAIPKMPEPDLHALIVLAPVAGELNRWSTGRPPSDLLALAKRYKVDAVKIRREAEEAAKEAEGGTRKEVIKKLPTVTAAKKALAKKAAKPAAKKATPKGGKKK